MDDAHDDRSGDDDPARDGDGTARRERPWTDDESLRSEVDRLWEDLADIEENVDEHTVSRSEFESEMKAYVRARQRRGHATGWGPYLVLLYGTAMTLGGFYYLQGVWAVLAMVVIWLSTLGLYTLMVLVGAGVSGLSTLGGLKDAILSR